MLPEFGSAFPFPFPFPFWLPFAFALPFAPCGGWDALRRWSVFIGNLLLHVLHTGTGWQKTGARVSPGHLGRWADALERQTEQTHATSTTRRWQKQLARRSTARCVGTASAVRSDGDGRKLICAPPA
jgi:hypothetical protein